MQRKIEDGELDQSLGKSDEYWIKENPVYCPIPWCNAHKHRFLRCGDAEGDYDGIHVGRVRYVKRFEKNMKRKIIIYEEAGVKDAEDDGVHEVAPGPNRQRLRSGTPGSKNMTGDTREVERRMRENLSAEDRFLLTRLALLYARTEDDSKLKEKREDALFDAADKLGFGDLGSQILDWAEKAIYSPESLEQSPVEPPQKDPVRSLEQHMLRDTSAHATLLARLDLKGRTIVEFGAGTGVLTKLILDAGVGRVDAYEIEPDLCRLSHPNLLLLEKDAREAIHTWGSGVISNPPYDLLEFIRSWVEKYGVADVILLIPEKARDLYLDYVVEATLPGTAFEPVSKGNHLLIRKGFLP